MKFTDKNNKDRLEFIDKWSKYVLEHDDKEWSKQQNKIINSCIKNHEMTKELYLDMKLASKNMERLRKYHQIKH